MQYIAASLGVQCTYCHVQGQNDLDDKDTKKRAREMMAMVQDINGKFFDGTQRLSCASCHNGRREAAAHAAARRRHDARRSRRSGGRPRDAADAAGPVGGPGGPGRSCGAGSAGRGARRERRRRPRVPKAAADQAVAPDRRSLPRRPRRSTK